MANINTQGEVGLPGKIVDSPVVDHPKSNKDSFYNGDPSPKSTITTSVNHLIK